MTSEFDVIARYFSRPAQHTAVGVGDDAALLACDPAQQLAVSTDSLVEGTHFFADADPYFLGRKVLAVNLSDMAACGAQPRWATLALTLPYVDPLWLERFSAGFFAMADAYAIDLIGGDTTRGPKSATVTILGTVSDSAFIARSGARANDDVWISGTLGDAALGLAAHEKKALLSDAALSQCLARLNNPEPRVELGLRLRGIATSAIDLSDGLVSDARHIAQASGAALRIEFERLPRSQAIRQLVDPNLANQCVLAGGDDYELLFTAAPDHREALASLSRELNLTLTRVGQVDSGSGVRICDASGADVEIEHAGYDHFA